MKCPFCPSTSDRVIDSRQSRDGGEIRRRRECESCGRRFTTYERVEEALPLVVKKDGRREPFDRDKLLGGLKKACAKRPVPVGELERIALDVEREVGEMGEKEIPSKLLGEKVLPRLRAIDEVAYVRFASIYRSFRDIDEFMSELTEVVRSRTKPGAVTAASEGAEGAGRSKGGPEPAPPPRSAEPMGAPPAGPRRSDARRNHGP